MSNLLADGDDGATSVPQTLAAGQVLHLVGASRGPAPTYWRVWIEREMSDGGWDVVGVIDHRVNVGSYVGVGDFRVRREPGARCIVDGDIA